MNIINDERKITNIGECENCGNISRSRPVKSIGSMGESRGYFNLCFDCCAPRIFWKQGYKRIDSVIIETPVYKTDLTSPEKSV